MEQSPHMEIVQIVIDKPLLTATDQAARKSKLNRSELVRAALREHLRKLDLREKEDLDRQGYSRKPALRSEQQLWESEAAWPPE